MFKAVDLCRSSQSPCKDLSLEFRLVNYCRCGKIDKSPLVLCGLVRCKSSAGPRDNEGWLLVNKPSQGREMALGLSSTGVELTVPRPNYKWTRAVRFLLLPPQGSATRVRIVDEVGNSCGFSSKFRVSAAQVSGRSPVCLQQIDQGEDELLTCAALGAASPSAWFILGMGDCRSGGQGSGDRVGGFDHSQICGCEGQAFAFVLWRGEKRLDRRCHYLQINLN